MVCSGITLQDLASAIASSRLVESDEEATTGPGKGLIADFGKKAVTTSPDGLRTGFT